MGLPISRRRMKRSDSRIVEKNGSGIKIPVFLVSNEFEKERPGNLVHFLSIYIEMNLCEWRLLKVIILAVRKDAKKLGILWNKSVWNAKNFRSILYENRDQWIMWPQCQTKFTRPTHVRTHTFHCFTRFLPGARRFKDAWRLAKRKTREKEKKA